MSTGSGGRRPPIRQAASIGLAEVALAAERLEAAAPALIDAAEQNVLTGEQVWQLARLKERILSAMGALPHTTDRIRVRLQQGGKL